MIKTNLTRSVGGVQRKMRRSAVAHSNQIMHELTAIKDSAPRALAYLPETIGLLYQQDAGMIVRECRPRPVVNEIRHLVPFFSLISQDSIRPSDPLLLCQIVERCGDDPFKAFVDRILQPLIEVWLYLTFERGLLPTAHLQNVLLEIDGAGIPRRIVLRDLQDVAIDGVCRRGKGLHTDFARHFIDDVEPVPVFPRLQPRPGRAPGPPAPIVDRLRLVDRNVHRLLRRGPQSLLVIFVRTPAARHTNTVLGNGSDDRPRSHAGPAIQDTTHR